MTPAGTVLHKNARYIQYIQPVHSYTYSKLPKLYVTKTRGFVQWFRGRALDSRLREPGFESCAVVLKPWERFFTLHCSISLRYIHEYLAIDSGEYVYEQPARRIM